MSPTVLLNEATRIIAIADIGLLYQKDEYDKERYLEKRGQAALSTPRSH